MIARQAGAQTSRPSISQFQDADDCVSRGAFVDPSQGKLMSRKTVDETGSLDSAAVLYVF